MFDETPEIANWNSLNLRKKSTRHNLVYFSGNIERYRLHVISGVNCQSCAVIFLSKITLHRSCLLKLGQKLLTAARRKSKLHTAISFNFLLSSDLIKWCHDSSTWRIEYEMSEPGTGCCVDIVDVSSQWCGLLLSAQKNATLILIFSSLAVIKNVK